MEREYREIGFFNFLIFRFFVFRFSGSRAIVFKMLKEGFGFIYLEFFF